MTLLVSIHVILLVLSIGSRSIACCSGDNACICSGDDTDSSIVSLNMLDSGNRAIVFIFSSVFNSFSSQLLLLSRIFIIDFKLHWWRELDSNQRRDKLGRFTVCCN